MTQADVSVGVAGAGPMGGLHARTVRRLADRGSGFRLVRVLDRHRGRAEALATAFDAEASLDVDEFSKHVDVAIVAVPTGAHCDLAISLIERGLDVLIEKPLAANIAEGEAIVSAARAAGSILQVGHVEWYNPAWRSAATRAGELRRIEVDRFQPPSLRGRDIDVVQDLMLHDLDWTTRLIDAELLDVKARGLRVEGARLEEVEAQLLFEGGCVVELRSSRLHSERRREARFDGIAGSTAVNLEVDRDVRMESCSREFDADSGNDPLERQWLDFIASCRSRTTPVNDGRVGVDALLLIDRVRDAAACEDGSSNLDDDSRLRR
jgi:predicted dehydrogenase